MKTYKTFTQIFTTLALSLLLINNSHAQSCTPQGNPATYGTGTSWIGYIYQGKNFNTYKGYINEGNSSANFDESFSGAQTNFATNGCPVYTDTFSVRYKLTRTFAAGNYTLTVGGDDGYRLSLDGGATWAINNYTDHSYTTTTYSVSLSGSYNMVLEYYESFGDNRISFTATAICTGNGDPAVYGTSNVWNGYYYQGMNFDTYKGYVTKGSSANPNFDENFGNSGSAVTVYTSNCSIQTQAFSARYRLQKTLAAGKYIISVGGDDGYRFSIDGGATWVINKWGDQSYNVTTYTATLSGAYNFVIEYYQNGGNARVSFDMTLSSLLPVTLTGFAGNITTAGKAKLNWTIAVATGFKNFTVQRSTDGAVFTNIQVVAAQASNSSVQQAYSYTDQQFSGNNYYRLAMTDNDGTSTYSAIIHLQGGSNTAIKIYPTLVENNSVNIESGKVLAHGKAVIYDMNGRKLIEQALENVQGSQSVTLTTAVKAGSYIVTVSDSSNLLAKQIIIVQ